MLTISLGACAPPATPTDPSLLLQEASGAHRDRGPSWMAPAASSKKELLYVSDWNTDDVFVYDYKSGTLVGMLTGFAQPYGQCVDKNGDVWITNFDSTAVVEYAHGGSKPIATLKSAGRSAGCSVDPTSGDLAVANLEAPAELQIFPHASGQPKTYTNSACDRDMWSPGYGKDGNLYVEASRVSTVSVCELPRGAAQLKGPVKLLNFAIGLGGGVMWDGTHLDLTDQYYDGETETALYQVSEKPGGNLEKIGLTVLEDSGCGGGVRVPQPFILGAKNTPMNHTIGTAVVGGNLQCLNRFDFWHYPVGGKPRKLQNAPDQPFGQSVSIAP